MRRWWEHRRDKKLPKFWIKGMEPCSQPELHNISSATNVCRWCGLSLWELALAGTLGGKHADVTEVCPVCKTSQPLSPELPGKPRQFLPHSIDHKRCKGSGKDVPGTEGPTWWDKHGNQPE